MHKICDHRDMNGFVEEGLTSQQAFARLKELNESLELDTTLTNMTIFCDDAIKTLRKFELKHLLDLHPQFYKMHTYCEEHQAFKMSSKDYDDFRNSYQRFVIVQQH